MPFNLIVEGPIVMKNMSKILEIMGAKAFEIAQENGKELGRCEDPMQGLPFMQSALLFNGLAEMLLTGVSELEEAQEDQQPPEEPEDDECAMGVGDGSGNLFVHGSYEAIKRLQDQLLHPPIAAAPALPVRPEDLRLLRSLLWRSNDKDNMEYDCRASCYQVDALNRILDAAGQEQRRV